MATRYGLEGPGIESWWGKIFHTYPDRLRGPPSLLYSGYRVFPGGKGGRGVMLTTHRLLVPRLRKSSAIPPLTLWVLLGLLRVFLPYPHQPWSPPIILNSGYSQAQSGRGVVLTTHPPPSSEKVKERVELYLYSSLSLHALRRFVDATNLKQMHLYADQQVRFLRSAN
jgi:hypothetical protein